MRIYICTWQQSRILLESKVTYACMYIHMYIHTYTFEMKRDWIVARIRRSRQSALGVGSHFACLQ